MPFSPSALYDNLHQGVLVVERLFLDDEDGLLLEHPGNAAVLAEVAAELREEVAHIGSRAVAVVRQDVEHDSRAARAVALVHELFIRAALRVAETFLDCTLDVVLRDVVGFRLRKSQLQAHVACGICAAHADCDRDLTADLRRDLAADGIVGTFLALDIGPFRMS